jgi:hypothetical protein
MFPLFVYLGWIADGRDMMSMRVFRWIRRCVVYVSCIEGEKFCRVDLINGVSYHYPRRTHNLIPLVTVFLDG